MDDLINQLEIIPLSGDDLLDMVAKMGNKKTTWIEYDSLSSIRSINELFGVDPMTGNKTLNSVFVLLQIHNDSAKPVVGHWIVLTLDDHNRLSYYDPYALTIEQDIKVTGESNLLPRLLKGIQVDVNRFQHQKFKDAVQTCGRHTAIRAFFHFMSNQEYNDQVIMPLLRKKEVKDADTFANLMTAFLSKSDLVVKMFFREAIADRHPRLKPTSRMMPSMPRGTTDPSVNIMSQRGGVLFR